MEIVTIEKRTFELWKQRFENFVGRVDALCVPYSQINNKIYYKASDVETFLLNQVRDNSKK